MTTATTARPLDAKTKALLLNAETVAEKIEEETGELIEIQTDLGSHTGFGGTVDQYPTLREGIRACFMFDLPNCPVDADMWDHYGREFRALAETLVTLADRINPLR